MALARQLQEGLLQGHGCTRVVTGPHHVADAVVVGFPLGVASVLPGDQMAADARGAHDVIGVFAVRNTDGRGQNDGLQQQAGLHRLRPMPGRGMHHLVPSTAASSASESSSTRSPRLMPILPPGSAQALGKELFNSTNS